MLSGATLGLQILAVIIIGYGSLLGLMAAAYRSMWLLPIIVYGGAFAGFIGLCALIGAALGW